MIKQAELTFVVFVDRQGREYPKDSIVPKDAIELRCAGAGWRWHDFEGHEWGSAGAPIEGESMPRWCRR